jgi:hypothetical protein
MKAGGCVTYLPYFKNSLIIMDLNKRLPKLLLATFLLFIASRQLSYATGGFPDRPGRLVISASASYFFANSQWDSLGVKRPFPKNGQYTSYGFTLFAEYVISRRFAAVVTLPYVINNYHQDDYKNTSMGLTDMETGLKYYLANIAHIYYFSLQGTAITPLYTSTNQSLGYNEEGAELKLAFSGTGHLFGGASYFNLDDAVRQYFGTDGPIQDRYNATYGVALDKKFYNQLSVTLGGIYSQSNNKQFSPIFETNKDFSFLQASLSYGHSFGREFSIFISGGKFITGRNTGDGMTGTFALIYKLDYH